MEDYWNRDVKEKKINNILINIREGLNIIFEDILNNNFD